MGVILEPKTGESISCNWWNWRPTLELIRRADLLDDETIERAGYNGAGGIVSAEQAVSIARYIDSFIDELDSGSRVLLDGAVTDKADDFKMHYDEQSKNYSATRPWLDDFRKFCRTSGGFEVF